MFTGIIEGLGTITAVQSSGQGRRLSLASDFNLDQSRVGDSIAVNGACLTAVTITGRRFTVDVSPETLGKTTLGAAKVGDRVNLERALRFSDRIDGHLVSGHVDGIGIIKEKKVQGNATNVTVEVPDGLARYMIEKGSVAVDGISLTINACDGNRFEVSIIPHTAVVTTVSTKKVAETVNIETDMIGKYVERFVGQRNPDRSKNQNDGSSIDLQFLAKNGFL